MAKNRPRAPRTWRCLNPTCGAVWCDLVHGTPRFHSCRRPTPAELVAGVTAPNPEDVRDENIVQDHPGAPAHIKAAGAGRVLLAEGDLVTEATITEYLALRSAPAIGPSPAPEDEPVERDPRGALPARAE